MAMWMCFVSYNFQLALTTIDRDQQVYVEHIFKFGLQSLRRSYCARRGICDTFCKFIINWFSYVVCEEILKIKN